jgi:hypothetical protein
MISQCTGTSYPLLPGLRVLSMSRLASPVRLLSSRSRMWSLAIHHERQVITTTAQTSFTSKANHKP